MDPNQRGHGRGRVRLVEPRDPRNFALTTGASEGVDQESTLELVPNLAHLRPWVAADTIDLTDDRDSGNIDMANTVEIPYGENLLQVDIENLAEMFPNITRGEIETEYRRFIPNVNALALTTDFLIARCKSPAETDGVVRLVHELCDKYALLNPDELYARIEAQITAGFSIEDVRKRMNAQYATNIVQPTATTQIATTTQAIKIEPPFVMPAPSTSAIDYSRPVPVTPTIQPGVSDFDIPGPSNALDHNDNKTPSDTNLSQQLQAAIDVIIQMFPIVEPAWVLDRLTGEGYKESVDELVTQMLTEPNCYDKIVTKQTKELTTRRREDMIDLSQFSVPEFLRVFPDPIKYFSDTSGTKTHLYQDHALVALLNDFPILRTDFIRKTLLANHKHLYPTYKQLRELLQSHGHEPTTYSKDVPPKKKVKTSIAISCEFLKRIRTTVSQWPANVDEAFFKELQFARWQNVIDEYYETQKRDRERRFKEARITGNVCDCEVCYEECISEDMLHCPEDHKFCNNCVVQMVELKVGEGHHKIACLGCDCVYNYEVSVLRHVLKPPTFNRLVRNMQQFELREANIPNLCTCPFCDFAIVIDNEHEKLFRCLNPTCLKVSCRECQEENHIPLRCNEVEQNEEVKMRTYIEEKCAQALIRKCPTCQKPIIKDTGCNHMRCPCGAHFCYVCNELMDKRNPYAHFKDGPPMISQGQPLTQAKSECKANTPLNKLHEEVALKAAKEARDIYLKEHPEMKQKRDVDVKQLVDEVKVPRAQAGANGYPRPNLNPAMHNPYAHPRFPHNQFRYIQQLMRHNGMNPEEAQQIARLQMHAFPMPNMTVNGDARLREEMGRYLGNRPN